MQYMSHLKNNYRSRSEFFPSMKPRKTIDERLKVKNLLNIRKGDKDQGDSSSINKISSAEMYRYKKGGKHYKENSPKTTQAEAIIEAKPKKIEANHSEFSHKETKEEKLTNEVASIAKIKKSSKTKKILKVEKEIYDFDLKVKKK